MLFLFTPLRLFKSNISKLKDKLFHINITIIIFINMYVIHFIAIFFIINFSFFFFKIKKLSKRLSISSNGRKFKCR